MDFYSGIESPYQDPSLSFPLRDWMGGEKHKSDFIKCSFQWSNAFLFPY